MKKILLLLALLVAYYAHARFSFSEPRVATWLMGHETKAMSGNTAACDDYSDSLEVNLTAQGRSGRWEVEGGKNEMCGYLKQAAAAFTVLQASTNSEFSDFKILPSGFPWNRARVTYRQLTHINVSGMPPMTIKSDDALILARTISGLKIQKIESQSTGGL